MRLPYAYVSKQVDMLFERQFDLNQTDDVNAWCDFIIEYIESCGWNINDYVEAMWFAPMHKPSIFEIKETKESKIN